MKKILFLLLIGFAAAFVSCNKDKEVGGETQWFRQPVVEVDGTSVSVKCLTLFGKGVLATSPAGFVFIAVSGDPDGAITVTDPVKDESILSCLLSGLKPETSYIVYAYVEVNGERFQSQPTFFDTGKGGEDPGPDPETGISQYTGWAELPAEVDRPDDYFYAAHLCPDFTVQGRPARNYTVCYSAELRCPIWSAQPLHSCYFGDQSRTDDWAYDPQIPAIVQPDIVKGSYKQPDGSNAWSRGHLTASEDRTVTYGANAQTFYVTNVAPQLQNGFNGGIWSTLEDHCRKNARTCADTLFVVTGVHFANLDTRTGDNATPRNTVYVPTNFYKVLIRSKSGSTGRPLSALSAGEIECVGWWFENKSYTGTKLTKAFMRSVADIEQETGLTFFTNVSQAPKNTFNPAFWGM